MKTKEKSWLWWLTFPFAHRNYTVVYGTIFYPPGRPPSEQVVAHEAIHERQAKAAGGWTAFYLLYLFCLPLLWNPWRYKWELEAYLEGSKYDERMAKKILRTAMYGWLRNG